MRSDCHLGFAITGSFCTFEKIKKQIELLRDEAASITPIFSQHAYELDTRFAETKSFVKEIETITGRSAIHTIQGAEPVGPKKLFDALVIAPCTGNTAAKLANADGFIKMLPDGYNTMITGDGGSLSQGQKQLLCIARVMLCLPPMLILDEATSSIDTRTEVRIQKAFARMMQGRTSFIVAHRLSTIREADVILVMKDGHIVEQGNHDELLAAGGFYAKLYNSQFEGVET